MDLIIPNAFADDKLEYLVGLWTPDYAQYVEGGGELSQKDYAVEKIRDLLYSQTNKLHKQKEASKIDPVSI